MSWAYRPDLSYLLSILHPSYPRRVFPPILQEYRDAWPRGKGGAQERGLRPHRSRDEHRANQVPYRTVPANLSERVGVA